MPQREVLVGTTNIDKGEFVTLYSKDMKTMDDVADSEMCSGAFPIAFPY